MDYGVFNDEGLLENGFGTMGEAEAARDRYNKELSDEGYAPDCYAAEVCGDCECALPDCECGNEEDDDDD